MITYTQQYIVRHYESIYLFSIICKYQQLSLICIVLLNMSRQEAGNRMSTSGPAQCNPRHYPVITSYNRINFRPGTRLNQIPAMPINMRYTCNSVALLDSSLPKQHKGSAPCSTPAYSQCIFNINCTYIDMQCW